MGRVKVKPDKFAAQAEETAKQQRALQAAIDRKGNPSRGKRTAVVQTGARRYPAPSYPKQHQAKPGAETALEPAPMYEAPHYKGSEKLRDMAALITGGDSGIGRAVAVLYAREGADVATS